MMRIFSNIPACCFLFLFSFSVFAQKSKDIPRNLTEALDQYEKIIPDSVKQKACSVSEEEFICSQAAFVLKKWGLIKESRLAAYFYHFGISSPDDMAMIVNCCYYRKHCGKELKLISQIKDAGLLMESKTEISENEDSVMNYTPSFPIRKIRNYIYFHAGTMAADFSQMNSLLSANAFPVMSRNCITWSMGYTGTYGRLLWNIEPLAAVRNTYHDPQQISGSFVGVNVGGGYQLLRSDIVNVYSVVNYCAGTFDLNIIKQDDSPFFFQYKEYKSLYLNQTTDFVNAGLLCMFNLIPYYNASLGIRAGYSVPLGTSHIKQKTYAFEDSPKIGMEGLSLSLMFLIRFID